MIDDMALLKLAMEQMDAEDPAVAQTAKDRAAQILGDAGLSFSKMAELIEQRRLLLRPRIVASIKRMDQPGMLGESAFRDTGSALRKEGQSFAQIAEAIELTGRLAPRYEDPVPMREPLHRMVSEPGAPAWRRGLVLVTRIAWFGLRRRIWLLAVALLAIVLFYALQASGYFNGDATVRHSADKAMSSVNSFVNEHILRQSRQAAAPPTPPAAIPPAAAPAPSPPSATVSAAPAAAPAPPATAPAPSATISVPAAPPPAAPAPPSAAPPGPPIATPSRDASGKPAAKSAANAGAAREDCCARSPRRAAFGDEPLRVLEQMIPPGIRRNSRTAGPCIGGVGGCTWGGRQY